MMFIRITNSFTDVGGDTQMPYVLKVCPPCCFVPGDPGEFETMLLAKKQGELTPSYVHIM